jgi:hypothetical protein
MLWGMKSPASTYGEGFNKYTEYTSKRQEKHSKQRLLKRRITAERDW